MLEKLLQEELKKANVDIAVIPETNFYNGPTLDIYELAHFISSKFFLKHVVFSFVASHNDV
jgi:hypothetical protein